MEVGDISLWCGGVTRHGSHTDGLGVDIRTKSVSVIDRNNASYSFDKDKSVEFAKICYKCGFERVITLCPHIAATCNSLNVLKKKPYYVPLIGGHQHHYHIDWCDSGLQVTKDNEYLVERAYCNSCAYSSSCDSKHKTN